VVLDGTRWLGGYFHSSLQDLRPDGSSTAYPGQSGEVTNALSRLGAEGYEVVACIGVANWILWTLKRRS
jgi:hypothetical protein